MAGTAAISPQHRAQAQLTPYNPNYFRLVDQASLAEQAPLMPDAKLLQSHRAAPATTYLARRGFVVVSVLWYCQEWINLRWLALREISSTSVPTSVEDSPLIGESPMRIAGSQGDVVELEQAIRSMVSIIEDTINVIQESKSSIDAKMMQVEKSLDAVDEMIKNEEAEAREIDEWIETPDRH